MSFDPRAGAEDALAPAGPQAGAIAHLFTIFLVVSVVVWALVCVATIAPNTLFSSVSERAARMFFEDLVWSS